MSRPWAPAEDRVVRRLRATGMIWSEIGKAIGRDGACCRHRLLRVLREPDLMPRKPQAPAHEPARSMESAPLPPGHPSTWGLLTAGTVLDGSAYR